MHQLHFKFLGGFVRISLANSEVLAIHEGKGCPDYGEEALPCSMKSAGLTDKIKKNNNWHHVLL